MADRVKDARVRKTERRLRDALVSLIHEKSYPTIIVKEILERADVGRSAFYAHFHDKDALLASSIDEMLHGTPIRSIPMTAEPFGKALWFSLPVFEYIGQCRRAVDARMARSSRGIVHQHLHRALLERISADLKTAMPRLDEHSMRIPARLIAEYIASTFILVLNWWIESRSPLSPQEVDDVFRALVLPTLEATIRAD